MASTTKIMTALVAIRQYDLEKVVVIEPKWSGIEGSSMYLRVGESLRVIDLLFGLLLASGNDAAEALAGIHRSGAEGFVHDMNMLAEELGLESTHFENPSGLDGNEHYSTALDMARLTAAAMKDPIFSKIVSTSSIRIGDRYFENHNRLLKEIDACGVKTGYTKSCGRCLVSAKEQNGRMLICVTLSAPDDWVDHKALYTYGFSQFSDVTLHGAGDCGSVELVNSERKVSRLYTAESYYGWYRLQDLEKVSVKIFGPRFWYGTVTVGEVYGRLCVLYDKEIVFETPVYFADTSGERLPEKSRWRQLMDFIFG